MTAVESTAIKAIGVQEDNLIIDFYKAGTYSYTGASKEYHKIINADSIGMFFNIYIKPNYQYTQIKRLD